MGEASCPPVAEGCKLLWLVRYAESEKNVSKKTFSATLGSQRIPQNKAQWSSIGALALVWTNTPLSVRGVQQALSQRKVLDAADFVASQRIEVVFHPPLQRASTTCHSLFGDLLDEQVRIEQFDQLYERSVKEHVQRSLILPRVNIFVAHLRNHPETRIVAVGHSSFFEAMCGIKMDNASVWRATLTPEGTWCDVALVVNAPDLATCGDAVVLCGGAVSAAAGNGVKEEAT